MAKSKRFKYISYVLRFAVAGGALYFAFRGKDFGKVTDTLYSLIQQHPWIVLLAAAAWLASQLLFVTRWRLLLTVQSIHIGYWTAFRLHLLGIFYNNCLPSAVGGDFLRAWYVTTHTDKKFEAAMSVFVDRFIGFSGMVIMAVTGYSLQTQSSGLSFHFELSSKLEKYWPVLTAVVLLPAALLAVAAITIKGRALLTKCAAWLCRHGVTLINKTRKAMLIYWGHKIALLLAYVLTFLCQGVFILGLVFVGRSIGMECPARYYFVFLPVAWVVGALPVSVGGLGIWEGVLILMFSAVGVSDENSRALALVHRALWLFGSLPGVIIHLSGAHLPKDFSVDYDNPSS